MGNLIEFNPSRRMSLLREMIEAYHERENNFERLDRVQSIKESEFASRDDNAYCEASCRRLSTPPVTSMSALPLRNFTNRLEK